MACSTLDACRPLVPGVVGMNVLPGPRAGGGREFDLYANSGGIATLGTPYLSLPTMLEAAFSFLSEVVAFHLGRALSLGAYIEPLPSEHG